MTNNKYCYDIHHTLAIDYINGEISIGSCCQSGRTVVRDQQIDQLWNNTKLLEVRQLNLQGQITADFCNMCVKVEQAGNQSRRTQQTELYKDCNASEYGIKSLDIKLGNLCNLKCTICDPHSSTAWIPDAIKMGIPVVQTDLYSKQYNSDLKLSVDDPLLLKDLKMIKFWGGEPLINEKHADILEFLDQIGVLKNCRVVYNTNGTHRVSDRVLNLWARAQLVELYFSIDDISHRFDYQRYGASWAQVTDNLCWYQDSLPSNHLFYIMCTVSYLNIVYLPELLEWKKQYFDTNRMQDLVKICWQPANGACSVDLISNKLKKFLIDKFASHGDLINFLNFCQVGQESCQGKFINYVSKLDSVRGTDWRKTFKELAELLDD